MPSDSAANALTCAVVGPFPPFKGGIAQHTAQLALGLEDHATVRRFGWIDQYPKALYGRPQIDEDAVPARNVERILRWWNPVSWLRVGRSLRSADAVILPWVSPVHALPYWVMMLCAPATTVVLHVHNPTPHEPIPFAHGLLRLVLSRVSAVVCHGGAIAEEVARLGGAVECHSVPHPPDIDIAATPMVDRPPFELLFAGTIREYKGLDLLLEALAMLGRSDINLTIAGEVWSEDARPSPAELDAVPGRVTTELNYVSDDRLCELLAASHALVAPYRSATQSGIVALAMAAGRPSLVTPVGALAEAVDHGRNGIVASVADDPRAIAAGIQDLLDNLDVLAAGAAASSSSWDDYAAEAVDLVRRARKLPSVKANA